VAEPRAVREVVARIRETIARRRMLKGGERIVVAVSGGPDSLAMLHTLARIAPGLDLELHVAHFDHRLRDGSAADAAFVGRAAARLGLAATICAADATDVPAGLSPEEAARERRYRFLEDVADGLGATQIATGHTLDDQAETVFMRVISGTGVHGLGGIPPVRGRIIRPLIDVRRGQTEAFCKALRLRPRLDPTNADPAFKRNAVRNDLIPALIERYNVRTPEALARLADIARDEDAFLGELAEQAVPVEQRGDETAIPVDRLLALPPALQRRALRRTWDLDAEHTENLLRLAETGKTGDQISLPAPLNARLAYGSLLIGRAPSRPEPSDPVTLAVPGVTDLSPWSMRLRAWIETRPPSGWPDGRRTCVLDAGRVGEAWTVRRPVAGDRFRPFGMSRSKRLGDFFTDAKVPREERERVALVTAGEEIAWVVGHRVDDRFRVTSTSERFLWMSVEHDQGGKE
jgi:tRNA(Ile)-lysidine synthase